MDPTPSNNVLVQQSNHNGTESNNNSSATSSQKRPMNAFLIFCKRHRSVVKSKYPHLENRSITKILGEWWAALDAPQKQKYTELARQYKEAFMKANPHFKWYKTDNFTPRAPSMQPSSSPPHHGLQSLHLNSNNNSSEVAASNITGTSAAATAAPPTLTTTGTLTLGPSTQQPPNTTIGEVGANNSSVMGIMKETQIHINNNHINHSSPTNNSTPKPPKKRYLENSEFRSTLAGPMPGVQQPPVNSVTATNPSVTLSNPVADSLPKLDKKATLAPLGPPGMLDGDTMSRVIVDALAAGPNPPPSTYMNYDRTSPPTALAKPPSDGDGVGESSSSGLPPFGSPSYHTAENDRSGSNSPMDDTGPKIQSVASLTAESLLNAESQQPFGSATKTVAAIVSAKHSNSSSSETLGNSVLPPTSSSATVPTSSQSVEEDKPLNLSSSKVLHASHQQIIDHFIDKLLSSGKECGEGNPMPVEMMQTSSSNCLPPTTVVMTLAPPSLVPNSGVASGSKNGPKKERTCKGKRYLDMITESKSGNPVPPAGGKKCKNNSGGPGGESESPLKDSKGHGSSGASKWVSGGFDLEEHIAALPQLGDAHLLTALNNSKNKVSAINGKGNQDGSHRIHSQGRNSDRDSDGSRSPTSPSGHGDKGAAFNRFSSKSDSESSSSEPCLKIGEGPMSIKSGSGSTSSRTNSPVNSLTNGHGSPGSNESSESNKRSIVARELLASAGFNLSRSSQGIEVGPCDGLAALAEVALSQAQAISTTTSS